MGSETSPSLPYKSLTKIIRGDLKGLFFPAATTVHHHKPQTQAGGYPNNGFEQENGGKSNWQMFEAATTLEKPRAEKLPRRKVKHVRAERLIWDWFPKCIFYSWPNTDEVWRVLFNFEALKFRYSIMRRQKWLFRLIGIKYGLAFLPPRATFRLAQIYNPLDGKMAG